MTLRTLEALKGLGSMIFTPPSGQQIAHCSKQRNITHRRTGFTLIETALATIIVGVGVLAIVSAQQAFHQKNSWSTHASTATFLGNEIREMTMLLPRHDPVTGDEMWGDEPNELVLVENFDDLDDFDGDGIGMIFSAADGTGPLNAQRQIIPNMDGWAQIVTVSNIDYFDINFIEPDFPANGDPPATMVKVEVVVTYHTPGAAQPTEMTRVSWISAR